jgi:uncharacterized protein YwqG
VIDARLPPEELLAYAGNMDVDLAAHMAAAARPGVRFATRPEDGDEHGASRFGGPPDLAPATVWPQWQPPDGNEPRALSFVAQIRLDDTVDATDLRLPPTGLLSFFCDLAPDGDLLATGMFHDEHRCSRVLHQPEGRLHPRQAPAGAVTFPAARLEPVAVTTVPGPDDSSVDDAGAAALDRLEQALEDHLAAAVPRGWRLGGRHQLGGHARAIQHPVEEEALQAARAVVRRDGVFDEAAWQQARRELPAWRLLFQLDSDRDLGVTWGDEGSLYWAAPTAALEAGAWDDVWFVFQCY